MAILPATIFGTMHKNPTKYPLKPFQLAVISIINVYKRISPPDFL